MHGAPLNYDAPNLGIAYDGELYPRDYYMYDADDRPWKTKNGQRWFGVVKDIVSGIAKGIPLISHSMNIGKMIDNGWGSGWFG